MSKRSYNQYCAVARALDTVGERWTLLVVRELMTGPKRFKDLLEGLAGIGTNLLTARLKALEGQGIIRRATLPPPAGSNVYELTELGRSLEPVIVALARWGLEFLADPHEAEDLRPGWAVMAVRSGLKSETASGIRETYEFRIDEEVFHVRIEDGEAEARQGPTVEPDLVISGDTRAFLAVAAGRLGLAEATKSGEIQVHGNQDALERCLKVFGLAADREGSRTTALSEGAPAGCS